MVRDLPSFGGAVSSTLLGGMTTPAQLWETGNSALDFGSLVAKRLASRSMVRACKTPLAGRAWRSAFTCAPVSRAGACATACLVARLSAAASARGPAATMNAMTMATPARTSAGAGPASPRTSRRARRRRSLMPRPRA
jgi:hypothetical protein